MMTVADYIRAPGADRRWCNIPACARGGWQLSFWPSWPPSPVTACAPRRHSPRLDRHVSPATPSPPPWIRRQHTITGEEQLVWRNATRTPARTLQFHLYYNAWRNAESTWMRERAPRRRRRCRIVPHRTGAASNRPGFCCAHRTARPRTSVPRSASSRPTTGMRRTGRWPR